MLMGILTAVLACGAGVAPGQEPAVHASPAPAEPGLQEEAGAEPPPGAEAIPPGAPTIGLAAAVALALEQNFSLLNAADSVTSARLQEGVSRAKFYPKLTPRFQRSGDNSNLFLDAEQKLPWTGATLTASANMRSFTEGADLGPFPRTSDLRLLFTQPLLRGFGPNATFFELRQSRRSRQGQERQHELARQRLAVDVARSFYRVVQQRQLLGVARQSLDRSEKLRRASESRLQVGLVSKLDVFRAELQASQAQESMVRAETALEAELERFRTLLGLSPTEPLQPEAADLPEEVGAPLEPVEVLTQRAFDNRLDLKEALDLVGDARRTASLARQNLLPRLDLNLGVSQYGTGTTFENAFQAADRRFTVFLSTSYPLERSTEAANRAVAELGVTSRERSLRQRRLELEAEVRAAVRELQRLRKSIELQKKGVEVAEQQLRLATLRYQRGLASNFDVVDAEGSLVVARSALVGLLTDYQVARVDLARTTGTLDVDTVFAP